MYGGGRVKYDEVAAGYLLHFSCIPFRRTGYILIDTLLTWLTFQRALLSESDPSMAQLERVGGRAQLVVYTRSFLGFVARY